jgi:hypothetical protein
VRHQVPALWQTLSAFLQRRLGISQGRLIWGLEMMFPKLLTSSFNLGASLSESTTLIYTTATQNSTTTEANQCGYWTFIQYVMTHALLGLCTSIFHTQLKPLTTETQILRNSHLRPNRMQSRTIWILYTSLSDELQKDQSNQLV